MKRYFIAAGMAMAFLLSVSTLSFAGDRIIYHTRSPVAVYSPHPAFGHGYSHRDRHWRGHYKRHHHEPRYYRPAPPRVIIAPLYQPGFSIFINGGWR